MLGVRVRGTVLCLGLRIKHKVRVRFRLGFIFRVKFRFKN